MTVKEYIEAKLRAFKLSEADMVDISLSTDITWDDECNAENYTEVNRAMITCIESLLFSPRMSNINEGGFSVSWDYQDLGKYYLYLCRRFGIKPNEDAVDLLDLSIIKDISNYW